eukprot:COSAG02_NODE_55848_length_288_cov_0.825397_2_plen_36_part_01
MGWADVSRQLVSRSLRACTSNDHWHDKDSIEIELPA